MPGLRKPRRYLRKSSTRILAAGLLATLAVSGCGASTNEQPNAAGSATVVPGSVPTFGSAAQGSISVSGLVLQRAGDQLIVNARIQNGDGAADQLETISSQVSTTLTLSPALTIPAKGSVELGGAGTKAVLIENARLPTGGTVALTLKFKRAGSVQVFSQFN